MPNDATSLYQEWLYSRIEFGENIQDYGQLLLYLSGVEFTWTIKHDGDRAEDGHYLRSEFGSDIDIPVYCSVLEMMIALAIRCDEIIYDPEYGDRVGLIFWCMVDNLGLTEMDKFNFDKDFCDEVITTFLKRRYLRDGRGGLFVTRNPKIDMRKSEIWYQMGTWIEENF